MFLRNRVKILTIVSCCVSFLLNASEDASKPFSVKFNKDVSANYYGKRTISVPKLQVMYPIFVYDSCREKTALLNYGKPVRNMRLDEKEVLHIDLSDGSKHTHSLKD